MTTYFTPVGTLAELTRAKGSDINAREAAVTSGFSGIETAIVGASGAGSISLGTNWFLAAGGTVATYLQKIGGVVTVNFRLNASGAPGATLFTLPAGYRPTGILYVAGYFEDFSTGTNYPCVVTISAAGAATLQILPSTEGVTVATADTVAIKVVFWAA